MANEFALLFGEGSVGVVCLRLAGAAGLCAFIGFERERRDHAAGLRTNMLVGLAAATFAVITTMIVDQRLADTLPDTALSLDPLRLVEAVTGGVAFLAAGMIVFAKGQVHGLTTGASMWLSAAIGLAAGLGLWVVALSAALGGVIILTAIRAIEGWLGIRGQKNFDGSEDRQDR